jgi:hypothetical protein
MMYGHARGYQHFEEICFLHLQSRIRWSWEFPPNHCFLSYMLHDVISQKTVKLKCYNTDFRSLNNLYGMHPVVSYVRKFIIWDSRTKNN